MHVKDQFSPDYTPETDIQIFLIAGKTKTRSKLNMDPQKSPKEVGQPLLPLQQRPPEYSIGFPPSQSYPSVLAQPVQHYGAPAASVQYVQGPNPVQTVVTVQPPVNVPFNPESDYLCCSIFTLLCCCMPLGSAALVYSITVSTGSYTCLTSHSTFTKARPTLQNE